MSKTLCKINIALLKVIPAVIAGIYLLNAILSYIGIDLPVLSMLGGLSLLPLVFLLLSSFTFKFCIYHRMFIYYVLVCDVITWIDFTVGIPISNRAMFVLNLIVAGVFLFLILYLKFKLCKR